MGNGQGSVKESVFKKDVTQLSNQEADSKGIIVQFEQVKQKLLAVEPKLKSSPNRLKEEAECLSNIDEFMLRYFGHLLEIGDQVVQAVQREQECYPEGYRNEATRDSSRDRMSAEVHELDSLEVKLLLYEVNDQAHIQKMASVFHSKFHEFQFGPFHAAILIGDVLLDWGPTQLVRPKRLTRALHEEIPGQRAPVFMGNLHTTNVDDETDAMFEHLPVRGGAERMQEEFKETISKLRVKSMEKRQLLAALAEVAVFYNTKQQYGLMSNNCHRFVSDVLNALGITNHDKLFQGKIKEFEAILIHRDQQKKKIIEYNSHQELDSHVQNDIDEMPREELEFAYCHYLLFHLWSKKFPKERAWACSRESCLCDELHKKLTASK